MCGRYFLKLPPELLRQIFGCENFISYAPSGNITPLQSCPIIVHRRMGQARWGLLPDYASQDDKALCAKLKNARSETVAQKPTFSTLWQKGRRALIPASGFFEWPEVKVKGQAPFEMTAPNAAAIAFAGLWAKRGDLVTFTLLTKAASSNVSGIHSRMPVAFLPHQAQQWFESSYDSAATMIEKSSIENWQVSQAAPLQISLLG